MLMDAFQDSDTVLSIRYRFDGNIFNLIRMLQAKTTVQTDVLDELLYADDMDKNSCSDAKMQRAMDQVSQSCDNYDLTISTKRQRLYTNQDLENRTMNQPSLWMDKNWKLLIHSPTWEALFPEQCTLMMRSLSELQKTVLLTEDSVQMSGSEMESSLTPSWKSTRLWYCQPSCMHVRPGQYTSVMQRDLTIST